MKALIMTVGLPRSGKSTWANGTGLPVVNPDAIRLVLHGQAFRKETEPMVWAIAKTMVAALFMAGHDTVILDATNITRERRYQWRDLRWRRHFEVFDADATECKSRAMRDGRLDLLPVIQQMAEQWEAATPAECEEE